MYERISSNLCHYEINKDSLNVRNQSPITQARAFLVRAGSSLQFIPAVRFPLRAGVERLNVDAVREVSLGCKAS